MKGGDRRQNGHGPFRSPPRPLPGRQIRRARSPSRPGPYRENSSHRGRSPLRSPTRPQHGRQPPRLRSPGRAWPRRDAKGVERAARAAVVLRRTVAGPVEEAASETTGTVLDVGASFIGETVTTMTSLRRSSCMTTWCGFPFVGAGWVFVRRPEVFCGRHGCQRRSRPAKRAVCDPTTVQGSF
jgi:hypothetical protein